MSIVAFPLDCKHFKSLLIQKHFSLLLIYFERGGKESCLEGLLKKIGLKNLGEKLRHMRDKRRRNKEGI